MQCACTAGPYSWEIYSYVPGLFHRPLTLYARNMTAWKDPPRTGWFAVGNASFPGPTVLSDSGRYNCSHQ